METSPSEPSAPSRGQVPPGQRVTRGWPILHEGPIPHFDCETWRLTVDGLVDTPVEMTHHEVQQLDSIEMRADFHCVSGWSKLDNVWRGVRVLDVLKRARPTCDAKYVSVGAEYGYTANIPLKTLTDPETLLAWGHNGEDLAPKHGWPLRLVVPRLYGWKSVKWVRSFELMAEDRRGFWEVRGYHNRADPWLEERYAYQEA